MRQIEVTNNDFLLHVNCHVNVELLYEKKITPFGNSAKIDALKNTEDGEHTLLL